MRRLTGPRSALIGCFPCRTLAGCASRGAPPAAAACIGVAAAAVEALIPAMVNGCRLRLLEPAAGCEGRGSGGPAGHATGRSLCSREHVLGQQWPSQQSKPCVAPSRTSRHSRRSAARYRRWQASEEPCHTCDVPAPSRLHPAVPPTHLRDLEGQPVPAEKLPHRPLALGDAACAKGGGVRELRQHAQACRH